MKLLSLLIWFTIFIMVIWCNYSCEQSKTTVDDLYHYAQVHKNDLRLSTYITVGAVETCLNDIDGRREAISVLRSFGITKAYIETYRSGRVADAELLATIRDYFKANGLEVAGGIATTPGKEFGVRQNGQYGWFNFQHPKTQQDLEKVVRLTARVFDEMIIDDFLCTDDTSEISKNARGDRSWSQYRMDLLTDLSEHLFVQPAREENLNITIIIKYPQWYDRFHLFGYDMVREPRIFDRVWVGTETRGPATQRMGYVQQYEGFVNFRWICSFAPDKVGGAWFDHIDCDHNDFMDQAYQTVLAGAREIILFNYFDLIKGHPGHHLLRRQFSTLIKLANMVHQQPARGVYAYKPPHSNAESDYYIFDYLGMIGIPLLPVNQFPPNPEVIFLPTQAAADTKLAERIESVISKGKTVILTSGLVKTLATDKRLLDLAGLQSISQEKEIKVTKLIVKNKAVTFEKGLGLAAKLKLSTAQVLLAVENNNEQLPFLTLNEHPSEGRVFVLNIRTFDESDLKAINEVLLAPKPISWLDLPIEWLNQVRQSFIEPLGFNLKGPGRVSVHPFDDNNWVICNFNNEPVKIDLRLKSLIQAKDQSFINKVTGEKLFLTDDKLHLSIRKREMLWIAIP